MTHKMRQNQTTIQAILAVSRTGLFKDGARRLWLSGLVLCVLGGAFPSGALTAQGIKGKPAQDANGVGPLVVEPQSRAAGLASRLNRRMASSLWQGRIAATPETAQQARDRQELHELIDRLNRVRMGETKPASVSAGVDAAPAPALKAQALPAYRSEPNDVAVAPPPVTPKEEMIPAQADRTTGELSSDMLERLTKLSEKPDGLLNPFAVAEILYASGHLIEAAGFYEKALTRLDQEALDGAQQRDWIIFQRANCLRVQQPDQAVALYQMLLREHPDSPWKESAQIWLKLAEWYSKAKPVELIEECEQLKVTVNRTLDELDS